MSDHILLRLRETFDAAHQLPYHDGKCAHLHGHTFQIEVGIFGEVRPNNHEDPQSGMVCDFSSVKSVLKAILPDHLSLNEPIEARHNDLSVPDVHSQWRHALINPTAENLARCLYGLLKDSEKTFDEAKVLYVRIWETAKADVTYPAWPLLHPNVHSA